MKARQVVITLLLILTLVPVVVLWSIGAATAKKNPVVQVLTGAKPLSDEEQERRRRILQKATDYCQATRATDRAVIDCIIRESL